MEPRKGFVYYRGFYEAMERLPDDEHYLMYKAVCRYALYGEEPHFEDVHLHVVFDMMREQLDANTRRYENGKRGGAPKGNKNAQKEEEQPKTTENNRKQPKDKEKEKEKAKEKVKEEEHIVQTPAGRSDEDVQKSAPEKPGVTGKDAEKVFATLWALYPSKKGKGRISDTKKKLLAKIGVEEMTRCIERYTADLAKEPWRKPQNGSTFFNSGYIDYLDENYREADGNGKTKWNTGIQEI